MYIVKIAYIHNKDICVESIEVEALNKTQAIKSCLRYIKEEKGISVVPTASIFVIEEIV